MTTPSEPSGCGPSDFERIGGEGALRPLIDDFVDGCFDDMMIGFLFPRNKRARVKEFEYEHAAEHLADIAQRWTGYHQSLRARITGDAKGECTP